jgi:hypothetical protein
MFTLSSRRSVIRTPLLPRAYLRETRPAYNAGLAPRDYVIPYISDSLNFPISPRAETFSV